MSSGRGLIQNQILVVQEIATCLEIVQLEMTKVSLMG